MNDNEIRFKLVNRMWRDNITAHYNQGADTSSIARYAVKASDIGRAVELLTDDMENDPACPVSKVARGIYTLQHNPKKVRAYLLQYGEEDDLPWDLR